MGVLVALSVRRMINVQVRGQAQTGSRFLTAMQTCAMSVPATKMVEHPFAVRLYGIILTIVKIVGRQHIVSWQTLIQQWGFVHFLLLPCQT